MKNEDQQSERLSYKMPEQMMRKDLAVFSNRLSKFYVQTLTTMNKLKSRVIKGIIKIRSHYVVSFL